MAFKGPFQPKLFYDSTKSGGSHSFPQGTQDQVYEKPLDITELGILASQLCYRASLHDEVFKY